MNWNEVAAILQAFLSAAAIIASVLIVQYQHNLERRLDAERLASDLRARRKNFRTLVSVLETTNTELREQFLELPNFPLREFSDNAMRSMEQLYAFVETLDITPIADFESLLRWALARRDIRHLIAECQRIVQLESQSVDTEEVRATMLLRLVTLETSLQLVQDSIESSALD